MMAVVVQESRKGVTCPGCGKALQVNSQSRCGVCREAAARAAVAARKCSDCKNPMGPRVGGAKRCVPCSELRAEQYSYALEEMRLRRECVGCGANIGDRGLRSERCVKCQKEYDQPRATERSRRVAKTVTRINLAARSSKRNMARRLTGSS